MIEVAKAISILPAETPNEDIIEIPLSEFRSIINASVELFNMCVDLIREENLIDKKESRELLINAQNAVKNEKSPAQKVILLNVYIKKAFKPIKEVIERRPAANAPERVIQATTKIKLRALMLYEHIKTIAKAEERVKDFAVNSRDVRTLLAGKEGQAPSRRDAIRAMIKAERLFPALKCGHTPNDGRQTMRLIARVDDLDYCNYIKEDIERDKWQRFRMDEVLPFLNPKPM